MGLFELLLTDLKALIETKFINAFPQKLFYSQIVSEYEKGYLASYRDLPALYILPGNQLTQPGPIANGQTRVFSVTLHLIMKGIGANNSRFDFNGFPGLYTLQDLIIQELARNKMINSRANWLEAPFVANELVILSSNATVNVIGLEIPIQYRRFVTWDGPANSQEFVDPVIQTGISF